MGLWAVPSTQGYRDFDPLGPLRRDMARVRRRRVLGIVRDSRRSYPLYEAREHTSAVFHSR